MNSFNARSWGILCLLAAAGPAFAATVTLEHTGKAPYELGSKVWFVPKLDGVGQTMTMSVNGIRGGNATVGTINEQNGEFQAPTVMPAGGSVVVSAVTQTEPRVSGSVTLTLKAATPTISGISPDRLTCGAAYTIAVTGLRYAADSVVWINHKPAPTTFVSATKLMATGVASQPDSTVAVKVVNVANGESVANSNSNSNSNSNAGPRPDRRSAGAGCRHRRRIAPARASQLRPLAGRHRRRQVDGRERLAGPAAERSRQPDAGHYRPEHPAQ